jgi:hypothetical protein
MELAVDQEYFLPHESLPVKVRITNFSGRTLHLGKDSDWLSFNIEGTRNYVISRIGEIPVQGEFELASAETATKYVDIAPYFDLSRPAHYKISATIRIPELKVNVDSPTASFDIMSGSKLWQQDFGVPRKDSSDQDLELRKYALVQTIHQKQLKLYLRVSNAGETRVLRVFPIGPMVSFSKPEPQLDRFSNLHVLYQTGARSFNYSIVNPEGLLISRETYDYTDTRPILKPDGEGRILVRGGVRRPSASDLPPPQTRPAEVSDATRAQ